MIRGVRCCSPSRTARAGTVQIQRGLAALAHAERWRRRRRMARGPTSCRPPSPPATRAASAAQTDWARIAALYGLLARVAPSPVVELNRAVAVGMAEGPQAALEIVDTCAVTSRCRPTSGCRACAATCSPSWAARPKPVPSSNVRPRWPATRASGNCCWRARPPCVAEGRPEPLRTCRRRPRRRSAGSVRARGRGRQDGAVRGLDGHGRIRLQRDVGQRRGQAQCSVKL